MCIRDSYINYNSFDNEETYISNRMLFYQRYCISPVNQTKGRNTKKTIRTGPVSYTHLSTTLISGAIEISSENEDYELIPNQHFVYDKNSRESTVSDVYKRQA